MMSCYELIRPYVFQPLLNSFFSPFCSTFYLLSFFLFRGISDLDSGLDKVGSSPCRVVDAMPLIM